MESNAAAVKGEVFNFGILHLEWPTALFILVVFVITMILMNSLLFKPVLRTLENRDAEREDHQKRLADLHQEQESARISVETEMHQHRQAAQAAHNAALAEASQHASTVNHSAKEKVAAKLAEAEAVINQEKEQALADAKGLSQHLAQVIQAKILS